MWRSLKQILANLTKIKTIYCQDVIKTYFDFMKPSVLLPQTGRHISVSLYIISYLIYSVFFCRYTKFYFPYPIMEFFGITMYGPQNYIKDIMREEYKEPMCKEDVNPLMEKVNEYSTLPKKIKRPDADVIRVIDVYIGRVNGFAYGSMQRFIRMKRKGVIKPVYPCDMYRIPPTTYMELGWWQHDPELLKETWYRTHPRYPQPASPNTLVLDKVRKNNKFATLF